MKRVPYITAEDRTRIFSEQVALGRNFQGEEIFFEGNALLFDDGPAYRNSQASYKAALQTDTLIQRLAAASTTEINAWVDANVTNVAQARTLFKKILVVLAYLLNKE
jgi:hypothetical protein